MLKRQRDYPFYCSSSEDDETYSHDPNDARNIPDRSKSDYYCQMCDSRMNSQQMWSAHIIGRRHLKNLKKQPGEILSKIKNVPCSNPPKIAQQLNDTNDIIVGLQYICETNRQNSDILYSCCLCQGTFNLLNIMNHIVSSKHRINYLKREDPSYPLMENLRLSKEQLESIVLENASKMEAKVGRGKMDVKIEKLHGKLPRSYVPRQRSPLGLQSNFHRPNSESRYLHIDLSLPSTSHAATAQSSKSAMATSSKSSSQKPAPSPKPQRQLTPEELDWDIERDAKHFTPEQVHEICTGIIEDFQNNTDSYKNPQKMETLKQCTSIVLRQYHQKVYERCTPEQKKNFAKNLTTDAWHQQIVKQLDKFSSW